MGFLPDFHKQHRQMTHWWYGPPRRSVRGVIQRDLRHLKAAVLAELYHRKRPLRIPPHYDLEACGGPRFRAVATWTYRPHSPTKSGGV
jgi:hypothetical protein